MFQRWFLPRALRCWRRHSPDRPGEGGEETGAGGECLGGRHWDEGQCETNYWQHYWPQVTTLSNWQSALCSGGGLYTTTHPTHHHNINMIWYCTVRVIDRRSKMSKLRTQLKTLPILDLNVPAVLSWWVLSKTGIKHENWIKNKEDMKV